MKTNYQQWVNLQREKKKQLAHSLLKTMKIFLRRKPVSIARGSRLTVRNKKVKLFVQFRYEGRGFLLAVVRNVRNQKITQENLL